MTTCRDGMITNLCETFAGISIEKGFNCSVARVERLLRPPQDKSAQVRPWVGLEVGPTVPAYDPGNRVRMVTRVAVLIWMDAADEVELGQVISDMDDDVWVALHADLSMGGWATQPQIIRVVGNEGDIQVGKLDAMLFYEIDIVQHRRTTLTTRR